MSKNTQESIVNSKENARILVCIPAFNEAKAITDIIMKSKKYADGVIVYDDGSTDDTYELAKSCGATVFKSPKNTGYGTAIRALFQAAKDQNADIMITLDSDGQHNPDQIPSLIEPLRTQGFDIVIGSRFLNKHDKEKVPRYRSFGIKTITKLTQSASYSDLTDSQSGFRAYNKMRKGRVARDLTLVQGARRENILYGSLTDEQRRSSGKDPQPCRLSSGGWMTALLLSHRARWLCSFVAPCQPPTKLSAPIPYL